MMFWARGRPLGNHAETRSWETHPLRQPCGSVGKGWQKWRVWGEQGEWGGGRGQARKSRAQGNRGQKILSKGARRRLSRRKTFFFGLDSGGTFPRPFDRRRGTR